MKLTHEKFDVIGDVHGCFEELQGLVRSLGYIEDVNSYVHPEGRLLIFIGDLVSRGPDSLKVVDLAARMVKHNRAIVIRGNNEDKLLRYLKGEDLPVRHGFKVVVDQINQYEGQDRKDIVEALVEFLEKTVIYLHSELHYLILVHAYWDVSFMDKELTPEEERLCMYAPMCPEPTQWGYHLVQDWPSKYPEDAPCCIMGHTPYLGSPKVYHNTICIDTASVYGGHLTAFSLPERSFTQVWSFQYWKTLTLGASPQYASYE